jgi:hypothetical protein
MWRQTHFSLLEYGKKTPAATGVFLLFGSFFRLFKYRMNV